MCVVSGLKPFWDMFLSTLGVELLRLASEKTLLLISLALLKQYDFYLSFLGFSFSEYLWELVSFKYCTLKPPHLWLSATYCVRNDLFSLLCVSVFNSLNQCFPLRRVATFVKGELGWTTVYNSLVIIELQAIFVTTTSLDCFDTFAVWPWDVVTLLLKRTINTDGLLLCWIVPAH